MTIPIHKMIRSRRRTLMLKIEADGSLIVRAPHSLTQRQILDFVQEKKDWIEKKMRFVIERAKTAPPALSREEEKKLKEVARDRFIERSCFYAQKMEVRFSKIRLSSARTRWGSCGPTGTLSFNWRLIQAPDEILDYVVVHELAHLIEKNHSARFWNKVGEYFPEYRSAKRWLKEHRL